MSASLPLAGPAQAVTAEAECSEKAAEPCVTLELLMERDYKQTVSTETVKRLAEIVPAKLVELERGETISDVIAREYGLGDASVQAGVPHQIQVTLEEAIRRLNDIDDPTAVPAGDLKIPVFVNHRLRELSSRSAIGMTTLRAGGEGGGGGGGGFTVVETESSPDSAATEAVRITVPRSKAAKILNDHLLRRFGPALVDEEGRHNSAITFQLADAATIADPDPTALPPFLSEAEIAALSDRLTRTRSFATSVIIFDSCWPSADARESARQFVNALVAAVNAKTESDLAPVPPLGPWSKPTSTHCERIADSLAPLQELERKARGADGLVPVIYIPLTEEQGATPVLDRLLAAGNLLRQYEAQFSTWHSLPPSKVRENRKKAEADAKKTLAQVIPAEWGSGESVVSSSNLIGSLFSLARFHGVTSSTNYIINTSWTVPGHSLTVQPEEPLSSLVVAALGNSPVEVGNAVDQVDYARRSYTNNGVIAVANAVRDKGLICCSSRYTQSDFHYSGIVAYHGALSKEAVDRPCVIGAADCGTSFAAPRVAWLLAAVEATKTKRGNSVWGMAVREAVRSARVAEDCPWQGYFNVTSFMQQRP